MQSENSDKVPLMQSGDSDEVPLEVYVGYEFFTVEQHARMLSSINGVYEALLSSVPSFFLSPPPSLCVESPRVWRMAYAFCTASAETGESIRLKFQVKKRWPAMQYKDGDLDVFLPAWTAIAFAVGAALTVGMTRWDQYMQIQKTAAETRKLNLEADRIEHELEKMDLIGGLKEPDRFSASELNFHVDCFNNVIAAPNIHQVRVNGISLQKPWPSGRP
jgi:hypothetical protein